MLDLRRHRPRHPHQQPHGCRFGDAVNAASKRKVCFSALTAALAHRDRCFYPLGHGVALELYRWMVGTVESNARWSRPTRWGQASLLADMGDRPSCTNISRCSPLRIDWREDLSRRLAHALFDPGMMGEWRKKMGIGHGLQRVIHMSFEGSDYDLSRSLDGLLGLVGRELKRSLNTSHPEAKTLECVELLPADDRWTARIGYGYEGSVWYEDYVGNSDITRASQNKGETIGAFLSRTKSQFEGLLINVGRPRSPTAGGGT